MNIDQDAFDNVDINSAQNSLIDLKRKAMLRKANGKSFIIIFTIYSIALLLFILIIRTHYTIKQIKSDNHDLKYDLDWKIIDSNTLTRNLEILQAENKNWKNKYKEIANLSIEYMTSNQNIRVDLVYRHSKFDSLIKKRDDIITELKSLQSQNENLMEELRKAKVINSDIS